MITFLNLVKDIILSLVNLELFYWLIASIVFAAAAILTIRLFIWR